MLFLLLLFRTNAPADLVTLENGAILEGKVRQWCDRVFLRDRAGQEHDFHRDEVRQVRYERRPDELVKPLLPDLTVAYIERLPRDPGFHGRIAYQLEGKHDLGVLTVDPKGFQLHPKPGEQVTFAVHILNAGSADAGSFRWRVSMDGVLLLDGSSPGIPTGDDYVVRLPWTWKDGQHDLQVELDTEKKLTEITRRNNTFVDPTRALTFFFGVHETTYRNFSQVRNVVDSFCFEDWAQYHVHMMNDFFARSKWPSAPDGIHERVRVDRIIIGPSRDERDYAKHEHRNGDLNDIIEYNGRWLFGKSDPVEQTQKWALSVDWGLPHELAHQLGLVDIYQLNVDPWQILVRRSDGAYPTFKYFFPQPKTMMHWHGPHNFSEQCANYLNQTLGRPRGYFGDYLYNLPEQVLLQVLDADGRPVTNATVDVFQRRAFKDPRHVISDEPIATGRTDAEGLFPLPNRPAPSHTTLSGPGFRGYTLRGNPFGHIHVVGANGTLLARFRHGGGEEFHFLTIFDLNVARARGNDKRYVHAVRTRFPAPDAPKPPAGLRLEYHLPRERQTVSLHWNAVPDAARYNVYMKVGDGGDTVKPFTLVRVVQPQHGAAAHGLKYFEKLAENGLYSPDTFLAVTVTDAKGRESGLSDVVGIPRLNEARKATVLPDGRVVFTSERRSTLWHNTASGGIDGFGIRPHYYDVDPWGVCADGKGNLIVADGQHNQVLVFDAKGDLIRRLSDQPPIREQKSAEPGKLDWPCDVAVDGAGNLYVLEREGRRVQSFDAQGKLRYAIDGGDKPWKRPSALSVCGNWLLVSDEGSGRVILYRLGSDGAAFEREVTGLRWPDRALLTEGGNLYVCDAGDNTLKVIGPDGKVLRRHESLELAFQPGSVKLDGPRGLCTRDGKTAWLVTRFPIRTCKVKLD